MRGRQAGIDTTLRLLLASQPRLWYQPHSEGGIIRTLETKVHTPIKVDRFFPSTRTCSRCGNIRDIGLDERIYVCPICGLVMDRDHNSSVNLEHEGLKQVVPTDVGMLSLWRLNPLRWHRWNT